MRLAERLGLWVILVAVAAFTGLNYGALQGLEESLDANVARLNRPEIRAEVLPGIPGELREAWRGAKNNAQEAGLADQLWLTVRLTNRGLGEAEEVVATLSLTDPIDGLYVMAADGDTFESSPYTPPALAGGGPGDMTATIEFADLAPGASHLIFVGLRPRFYSPAPYDAVDYAVWTGDYARHWNLLRVSASSPLPSQPETTFVEYGLGSAGLSVTTATQRTPRDSG